jgi:SAM-dependent methyltransferase
MPVPVLPLQPDAAYYQRHNARLLDLVPLDAALLLEIGCAAGELGRRYKWINPRCRYLGVEREPGPAQAARAHLDLVLEADVETLEREQIPGLEQGADCLIYGDVLEHLVDPWRLLERHREWLKPEGQILACAPNAQYWRVLRELVRGRFDYADEGVLDRTHLRFFTLATLVEMLQKAGLHVFEAQPLYGEERDSPDEQAETLDFLRALAPAAKSCGVDPAALERQALVKQYLLRAARKPPKRAQLLCPALLAGPASAGAGYKQRLYEPLRFLSTTPGVRACEFLPGQTPPLAADEERVRIQVGPLSTQEAATLGLRELLKQGWLLVTECDADPFLDPEQRRSEYLSLRAAHGVLTSSPGLAEKIRRLNPMVAVFPDQLLSLPPLSESRFSPVRDGLRVLVAARVSPAQGAPQAWAWERLAPALAAFARGRTGGFECSVLDYKTGASGSEEFARLRELDPTVFRLVRPENEPHLLELLDSVDIAVFPETASGEGPWSEHAALLCAAHGAVLLAGARGWRRLVEPEESGVLFEGEKAFLEGLARLASDPALRERLAVAAHGRLRERRLLSAHYRARLHWLHSLLAELPKHNRALRRRAPELFDR